MLTKKHRVYTEIFPENDESLGYICGLIASDGCLPRKYKQVSITLHEKDRKTLEWVSRQLVLEPKKLQQSNQPKVTFNATAHMLRDFLERMGIGPAKSLNIDVDLKDKSEDFKWAFLRGVIDGDGTINVGKDLSRSHLKIFSASPAFLQTLKREFGGSLYSRSNARGFNKDNAGAIIWILDFNGNALRRIVSNMPDRDFMISRKSQKILQLSKFEIGNGRFLHPLGFDTVRQAVEALNPKLSYRQVFNRIYTLGWSLEKAILTPPRKYGNAS